MGMKENFDDAPLVEDIYQNNDMDLDGSVYPLTVKNNANNIYPDGFNENDDLNNDGRIDKVENDLKVMGMKDEIRGDLEEKIRQDYVTKFRKEVDFHHKVAYRFEKAYRLGKKRTE